MRSAGYWNRPEETAALRDDDGWLRTGDVGHFDVDGFLYITDRAKDMVISGGENVYPAEVEKVLAAHPSIAEVAVIGTPDEQWGETRHRRRGRQLGGVNSSSTRSRTSPANTSVATRFHGARTRR